MTIASAALIFLLFLLTAYALNVGRGGGVGFLLLGVLIALVLAKYRRASVRPHSRVHRLIYVLAATWAVAVAVVGAVYWVFLDPAQTAPLWLVSVIALIAALPFAFVGARLLVATPSGKPGK